MGEREGREKEGRRGKKCDECWGMVSRPGQKLSMGWIDLRGWVMKVGRNDILILRPEPCLVFDKSEDVFEWADGKSSPKPALPF